MRSRCANTWALGRAFSNRRVEGDGERHFFLQPKAARLEDRGGGREEWQLGMGEQSRLYTEECLAAVANFSQPSEFTASTTASAVIPSFSITFAPGPLSPKRVSPTTFPSRPT